MDVVGDKMHFLLVTPSLSYILDCMANLILNMKGDMYVKVELIQGFTINKAAKH